MRIQMEKESEAKGEWEGGGMGTHIHTGATQDTTQTQHIDTNKAHTLENKTQNNDKAHILENTCT